MDDSLKARIEKLSKMTVENGCTSNEAEAASRVLLRIAAENGMTLGEVLAIRPEEAASKLANGDIISNRKRFHEVSWSINTIAEFFSCKAWLMKNGDYTGIRYFGFPEDVQAAVALTNIITVAMETECASFLKTRESDVHGKTLRKNFMLGFVARINARLLEIRHEHNKETTGSTDLVVVKEDVIREAMKDIQIKKSKQNTRYASDNTAYYAGAAAANNVSLRVHKEIES